MSDPQEQRQPTNPFASASAALALFALLLGSFARFGAAVGLVAVLFGGCGVVRAEKYDVGLAASVFGIVFGLVAVLWTATSIVSG